MTEADKIDASYLERLGKYEDQVEELSAQIEAQGKRLHELEDINKDLWGIVERSKELSGYNKYLVAAKELNIFELPFPLYLVYVAKCTERYNQRECVREQEGRPLFALDESPIDLGPFPL